MNLFLSCTAVILLHISIGQKPKDGGPCGPTLWNEVECKDLIRKDCSYNPDKPPDCKEFAAKHRNGFHDDVKKVFYEMCESWEVCVRIVNEYFRIEKDMSKILSLYTGLPYQLYSRKELIEKSCVEYKPPCKELDAMSSDGVFNYLQPGSGRKHVCMDNTKECATVLHSHCKDGNQNGAFCDGVYNKIPPELAFDIIPCDPDAVVMCDNIKKLIMKQIDGHKLYAALCREDVKSDKCGRLTVSNGWCSRDDEKKQEACQTAFKLKIHGMAKRVILDLADVSKFNKEFISGPSKISTYCDGNATADCKALFESARANRNIPTNKIVEIACTIKGNNEFDLPNVCDDVSANFVWLEEGVGRACRTREAQEKNEICKIMKRACGVDAYKAKIYCKELSEVNAKLDDQETVEMCKNASGSGKKDELSNCLSMASKICPTAADHAKCEHIFRYAFEVSQDKPSLLKTALHTLCQDFPKEDNPKVSDALKDKMTVCYLFADNVVKGSMMDKVFAANKSDEADECDIEKTDKFNDNDKLCKFIEVFCSNKTDNSCQVVNKNIKTQRWNKHLCANKNKCAAALDKYCIKSTAKCQDTVDLLQKECNIAGHRCEKNVGRFIKSKVSTDVVKKTCTEQTVGTTFCKTVIYKCKNETAGDECRQIMGYMNSLNKDEIENLENQILYCQIGAGVGGALCVVSLSMCFVCKGMANKSKKKKNGGDNDDLIQL